MWSWGLDNQYVPYKGSLTAPVSPAVEQAMVNLFADMGVQPQTLIGIAQAGAAVDRSHTACGSHHDTNGWSKLHVGQNVTITGTASDVGGIVAGVEVSTDGGKTWNPATGTTSWSYSWTAAGSGSVVSRSSRHRRQRQSANDAGDANRKPPNVALDGPLLCERYSCRDQCQR